MEISFTPGARQQLLEAVVAFRARDRVGAAGFVDAVERRLRGLLAEGDGDDGDEVDIRRAVDVVGDEHRFYTRIRGDVLWVLAVWCSPRVLPE